MMTNEKQEIIRNSASYKLVHAIALWMDRRLLDPLIGLVLPGFGDALTSKAIMQEIDRKAVGMAFLIAILCGLIYAMVLAAVKIVE